MAQRYSVIVFGCQFNKADGEKIGRLLERKGYKLSPAPEQADLVVVLVCSVRQSAVNRVYSLISRIKKQKLKKQNIILTWCILGADKKIFLNMGVEIKDFKVLEKIPPATGLITIGQGCNNFCSYCVVPYTRGREKYRSPELIIKEVRHLLKQGIKEITLVAQNVNSYKFKIQNSKFKSASQKSKLHKEEYGFVDLLKQVTALRGDFKVKFLTNHPKDFSDELIKEMAQNPKVVKYAHLPFQAGDNQILAKMNRGYTRQDYLRLAAKIKKAMPNVVITTDVIVGFPGETKKAFQNTVAVFKKIGFRQAFVAKYSPREGTFAYKLKDNVPLAEKKRREQLLLDLIKRHN